MRSLRQYDKDLKDTGEADSVVRCKKPRGTIECEQLDDVDLLNANGDGNVNAIFSNTEEHTLLVGGRVAEGGIKPNCPYRV